MNQKQVFIDSEADEWFLRNKETISNRGQNDPIINVINKYNISPQSILDVGCSTGYRLNLLKNLFPASMVKGIEPSSEAIKYGLTQYPTVDELVVGTADDLPYEDSEFDLIIVNGVFYVIDRTFLLRVYAELDRVLKHKGMYYYDRRFLSY